MEAHIPYELKPLPNQDQVMAPLLNYMRDHGVPIDIPRGMNNTEIHRGLTYEIHSYAVKERAFVCKYITEQLREEHVAILKWDDIKHLQGL